MWKFVQLVLWLIVFVYLMNLNDNLDVRGGAVRDAPVEPRPAHQTQGGSAVHMRESTR